MKKSMSPSDRCTPNVRYVSSVSTGCYRESQFETPASFGIKVSFV